MAHLPHWEINNKMIHGCLAERTFYELVLSVYLKHVILHQCQNHTFRIQVLQLPFKPNQFGTFMWAGRSLMDFCTPFPRTTTLQWQHHWGLHPGLAGVFWSGPRAKAAPDVTENMFKNDIHFKMHPVRKPTMIWRLTLSWQINIGSEKHPITEVKKLD